MIENVWIFDIDGNKQFNTSNIPSSIIVQAGSQQSETLSVGDVLSAPEDTVQSHY
jgi:hypothetical protein